MVNNMNTYALRPVSVNGVNGEKDKVYREQELIINHAVVFRSYTHGDNKSITKQSLIAALNIPEQFHGSILNGWWKIMENE